MKIEINFYTVWRQRTCVTNYVDQQTLKPNDDSALPHQRLWMFDVLVCLLSVTERFLLQPLVCGTVFHRTSLLSPPLSIFCCHLKSHLFSLSYPAFRRFSHLYSVRPVTRHFGHYYYYRLMVLYSCLTATEVRMSPAIWDHTVLPSTRHKSTHPALTPVRQAGWYSIYLQQRDGRLSWPRWLVTYRDGLPKDSY